MKIKYFFLIFNLLIFAPGIAVIPKSDFGYLIADEKTKLTQEIKEIVQITGIQPIPQNLTDLTEITQKQWLRKPGTERWDIDPKKHQELQEKLNHYLNQLQLTTEISLDNTFVPNYFLVMGGTAKTLKLRLSCAEHLLSSINCKPEIYILVGRRDVSAEEKEFLNNYPGSENIKTEVEVARFFINKINLFPLLKSILNDNSIVDTPGKYNVENNQYQRPTTDDTVNEWLKSKPKPGKICAVSTAPFVQYQDAILRSLLPKDFSLVTIGPKDDRLMSVGLYLDNLARWIYAENKHRQLLKNQK